MSRNADRPTAASEQQNGYHLIESECVCLRVYATRTDCINVFGDNTYTEQDLAALQRYTDSVVRATAQHIHMELICRSEFAAAQRVAEFVTPATVDVTAVQYVRALLDRLGAEVHTNDKGVTAVSELDRLRAFADELPSTVYVRVKAEDAHLYGADRRSGEQDARL